MDEQNKELMNESDETVKEISKETKIDVTLEKMAKGVDKTINAASKAISNIDADAVKNFDYQGQVKKLETFDLIALGLAGIALISLFLPVVTIGFMGVSESYLLISHWLGKLALVVILVTSVLVFLKQRLFALIAAGINALLAVISFFSMSSEINEAKSMFGELVKTGFGIYLFVLVSIALAVIAYLQFSKKE